MGLFCDLLWSDPIEDESSNLDCGWKANDIRGCSWLFGVIPTRRFLKRNQLVCLVRAHEA
jgi:serine/threonine-protein phosphatase 2B catalytic subunit